MASNTLINIEVEAIKSEAHLNYPVDKKKRSGSSQEIKFQGPEDTKRRVKKEVNQVIELSKIVVVKDVNSKSR